MQYAGVNPSNSTGISIPLALGESKVESRRERETHRGLSSRTSHVEPELEAGLPVLEQVATEATMLRQSRQPPYQTNERRGVTSSLHHRLRLFRLHGTQTMDEGAWEGYFVSSTSTDAIVLADRRPAHGSHHTPGRNFDHAPNPLVCPRSERQVGGDHTGGGDLMLTAICTEFSRLGLSAEPCVGGNNARPRPG